MNTKSRLLAGAALLLSAAATPALAQTTISPGMTTEQVRDRFGVPATTRASFGIYNDFDDVDALIRGIAKVQEIFS